MGNTLQQLGLLPPERRELILDQVSESMDSLIFCAYERKKRELIVAPDAMSAARISRELREMGLEVLEMPPRELLTHRVFSQSRDLLLERAGMLARLSREDFQGVLVCSAATASQRLIRREIFSSLQEELRLGNLRKPHELAEKLAAMGYEREIAIANPGEFAMRGDILDIWLPGEIRPSRLEFFGDEIDSIRSFNPQTQLSVEKKDSIWLYPAMESLDHPSFSEAMQKIEGQVGSSPEFLRERDRYYVLLNAAETLFDFGQFDRIWFFAEEQVMQRVEHLYEDYAFRVSEALERGEALPGEEQNLLTLSEFDLAISKRNRIRLRRFYSRKADWHSGARPMESYQGELERFFEDLKRRSQEGYRQIIHLTERAEAFRQDLLDRGFVLSEKEPFSRGDIRLGNLPLEKGFLLDDEGFALYTRKDLFRGGRKAKVRYRGEQSRRVDSPFDLKKGDYVVHVHHGIARYQGMVKKSVEGIERDYLDLEYASGDRLYVPTDHADQVQRYVGGDTERVRLTRLSTGEWLRKKARAKKSIEDMTEELLELYARREAQEGFAFSEDTPWQQQFEMDFEYEETPDQLRVIEEIKADMESKKPMDRLLCGDVGFGKTEVAFRAIFKAVMDSKQAVILAPTTILASQHYERMQERFSDYPMRFAMLSRLTPTRTRAKILKELKEGSIDVVAGTHMLLSDKVQFRDLGLLVIDEEQRFGVRHKERIRSLKNQVDTLAMSATPIPRTLNLSLRGIRDMSLLQQAPRDRYPVQTYITAMDENLIREAILREVERGGQVYYIHNRVDSLPARFESLQRLLPMVRMDYAHGQMNERQLEERMMRFVEGETQLLLSTTIVETGLDIANVNTILIEDAQNLGLAQLYQLRGRVGRSNRVAYAWLFYPSHLSLQPQAMDRLNTIKEFTDFGSGFRIALRDLEIRGSGNVLGRSQSGHFEEVGYELYMQMLKEHMDQLQGIEKPQTPDVTLDLPLPAYLPDDYIEDAGTKMEIYRKLRSAEDQEALLTLQDELLDRFGDIPETLHHLFWIARLRQLAQQLGILEISSDKKRFRMLLEAGAPLSGTLLQRVHRELPELQMELRGKAVFYLDFRHGTLERAKDVQHLLEILERVFLFKEEESGYNR